MLGNRAGLLLLIVQLDGESDGSPPDPNHVDLGLAVGLGVIHAFDRVIREDHPGITMNSLLQFICAFPKDEL